ncbi:MAG: ferritin-like domain-containing protein, partial [Burkholderiales bacterium]|nr:ferritin-like domain-containing protein [Burkholderiales bacterium]
MSTTTSTEAAPLALDLGPLGLDGGAQLLLNHGLRRRAPGQALRVLGAHPDLALHLSGWCRKRGLALDTAD